MSRFESAPGAEVSDEDDVSLTSQDYFEVANALKQKGGREAASPETRAQRAEERRQSRRDAQSSPGSSSWSTRPCFGARRG